MKNTLITTVFNEENEIEKFLNSILLQTHLPNEVIIVDAFSKDKTVKKILDFQKQNKLLKIKLLKKKGNIAIGRNEAIKNSTGDIIFCSDVGCVLDKNWIKNILKKFEDKSVDVVSGYYKPISNNTFEKCLSTYTCVMPDKIDEENFLPSSRSIAFKKKVWSDIGGYPEWLKTCEDLYFARELKRKNSKFVFGKDAIVFWQQRKNLKEAFFQFFNYAVGDGTARYIRPNTPFLFARYIIGLILLFFLFRSHSISLLLFINFLLTGYILWATVKNYKYVNKFAACIYLPILQFASDIAVIFGMSIGLFKSIKVNHD